MSAAKFIRNFLTLPQMGAKDSSCYETRDNRRQNSDLKVQKTEGSAFLAQDVDCINYDSNQRQKTVSDDTPATDPSQTLNHENGFQHLQLNLQRAATATAKDIDRNCFGTEKGIIEQVNTIANHGPTFSEARDEEIMDESTAEYWINSLSNTETHTNVVSPVESSSLQTTTDDGGMKDEKTEEEVMAPTDVFDMLFHDNIQNLQWNLQRAGTATAEDTDRHCFGTEKSIVEQMDTVTNHRPTCSEAKDEETKDVSTAEYVMGSFPNTEIHTNVVECTSQQIMVDEILKNRRTEEEVMVPTDIFFDVIQDYVKKLTKTNDLEVATSDDECCSIASSLNIEIFEETDCQDVETHEEQTEEAVTETGANNVPPIGRRVVRTEDPAKFPRQSNDDQGTSYFHGHKESPIASKLPAGSIVPINRGLVRTKDKENPFACGYCGKVYTNRQSVYGLIRWRHDEKKCSCGKRFAEEWYKANNMKIHFEEKPFTCNLCGMKFVFQSGLRKHHLHKHSEERPFPCKKCNKQFRLKLLLKSHMDSHRGQKTHAKVPCSVCGKTVNDSYMPTHMRMHSGEKPLKCNICLKKFPKKQNLEGHMRSHIGEKPFVCSGCDKRFALYSNMMTHKAKCNRLSENVT